MADHGASYEVGKVRVGLSVDGPSPDHLVVFNKIDAFIKSIQGISVGNTEED